MELPPRISRATSRAPKRRMAREHLQMKSGPVAKKRMARMKAAMTKMTL